MCSTCTVRVSIYVCIGTEGDTEAKWTIQYFNREGDSTRRTDIEWPPHSQWNTDNGIAIHDIACIMKTNSKQS